MNHKKIKKTLAALLGSSIIIVLISLVGCADAGKGKLTAEDTAAICKTCPPPDTSTRTTAALNGLPNNSFFCLRAGKDTVERWLDNATHGGPYARMIFSYYWPDRTLNGFTLIGFRNVQKGRPQNERIEPTQYTLKQITVCAVQGIGNDIILADQQVSIATIARLWGHREGDGSENYLKFTPMVNSGEEPPGAANACNCPRHLVYKIELILRNGQPYGAEDPGYTNPSPPKPPAD